MSDSGALGLPDDEVIHPTALLQTLLATALVAVAVLRPLYEDDAETIRDFAWVSLNPAGQQLLRQPERPAASLLTLFPTAKEDGVFATCCQAFVTGEVQRNQTYYQAAGLKGYFLLAAQRCENALVVNFMDTHERPRTATEEALPASQARERAAPAEAERQRANLTRAFEQAPVAFALFRGADLVVEFANPAMGLLLGRPVAAILGRPVFEAIPDMRGQGLEELLGSTFAHGTPHDRLEVPVRFERAAQGRPTLGYFNITYRPQYDAQGLIMGVVCVGVDMTEQVRARQQVERLNQELEARVQARTAQLAEQQLLLSRILGQVPASIATLSGAEHRYTFFNEQYQALAAGRAALGMSVAEVFPEVVAQGFVELLNQVYATGQPFIGRGTPAQLLDAPTGQLRQCYTDFIYQPLFDTNGHTTGILAFVVDVTPGVVAHQQADTLHAALLAVAQRQAQQRQELYQVVEQTAVAIVLLREPDHRIDYYNPAFAELFPPEEWPGGDLQGHPINQVYPRLKLAGLLALLDRVFQTGETQTILDMPLAELQPGSPRYITFTYQAYREQERIVGVAAFAYDVTEQVLARQQVHRLNEQLATTNQELQASNRQLTRTNADLDTFVYTASHDLKAPIANIEGLLDVLREYLPPAAQEPMVPRLVGMMQAAIARFQQTVGHLTDVSHLQQAPDQVLDEVDLAGLVEGVRLDLLPVLESTQAQLLVDVAACPHIRFATKNLRSIVYNLLSNAVKYRALHRAPVVQVRSYCSAQQVVLEVQDNGLGLDEQQQSKLFTLFKRLHTHVEGSGVGLYLIKRLIENAGGTLTAQSQLGVGSTFTVTLPRA